MAGSRYRRRLRLRWPIDTAAGEPVTGVWLVPPTLGALEELRGAAALPVAGLIAAVTGLAADDARRLRWPDAEAVLAAALELLPADLVEVLTAPPPEPGPMDAAPVTAAPVLIPAVPTDLDDDEAALPPANPATMADILGVDMEGIALG